MRVVTAAIPFPFLYTPTRPSNGPPALQALALAINLELLDRLPEKRYWHSGSVVSERVAAFDQYLGTLCRLQVSQRPPASVCNGCGSSGLRSCSSFPPACSSVFVLCPATAQVADSCAPQLHSPDVRGILFAFLGLETGRRQ